MSNLSRGAIVAVALSAIAAGCASTPEPDPVPQTPAVIYFANNSADEAAVYAIRDGVREVRIGNVMSGRTDTLTVPYDMVISGSMRIYARPLARNYVVSTGTLTLRPGEAIVVRLPLSERTLAVLPPE
jgi:hypothetical protein